MVVVRGEQMEHLRAGRIAWYARVSSADQKCDLERRVHRLRDYAAARGYQVAKDVMNPPAFKAGFMTSYL